MSTAKRAKLALRRNAKLEAGGAEVDIGTNKEEDAVEDDTGSHLQTNDEVIASPE